MLIPTSRRQLLILGAVVFITSVISLSVISNGHSNEKRHFLSKLLRSDIPMTTNITTPRLVIVLAYMHTGSSYTGSLFQQHPGCYYHFEALRSLQDKSRRNMSVQYLNGTHRRLKGEWVADTVAEEAVNNMLNCRYGNLDLRTLTEANNGIKGLRARDQSPFLRCVDHHKRSEGVSQGETVRDCIPYLLTPCFQADVRAFKFIRLRMSVVEGLVRDNSNLRVIHLVRDPRAMLDSQVRRNEMGSRNLNLFTLNTKRLCDKMHNDLELSKTFTRNIRNKIRLVRYEDLTDAPLDVAETLFKFTEVRFLDQDRSFVNQTAKRGNSSRLETWRRHISQEHIHILNKHCASVYKDFGYVEYNDLSSIRDVTKATYINMPANTSLSPV